MTGKNGIWKKKITMPLSIKHKNKFSLLEVNLTLWKRTHQWLFLSRETGRFATKIGPDREEFWGAEPELVVRMLFFCLFKQ